MIRLPFLLSLTFHQGRGGGWLGRWVLLKNKQNKNTQRLITVERQCWRSQVHTGWWAQASIVVGVIFVLLLVDGIHTGDYRTKKTVSFSPNKSYDSNIPLPYLFVNTCVYVCVIFVLAIKLLSYTSTWTSTCTIYRRRCGRNVIIHPNRKTRHWLWVRKVYLYPRQDRTQTRQLGTGAPQIRLNER